MVGAFGNAPAIVIDPMMRNRIAARRLPYAIALHQGRGGRIALPSIRRGATRAHLAARRDLPLPLVAQYRFGVSASA